MFSVVPVAVGRAFHMLTVDLDLATCHKLSFLPTVRHNSTLPPPDV